VRPLRAVLARGKRGELGGTLEEMAEETLICSIHSSGDRRQLAQFFFFFPFKEGEGKGCSQIGGASRAARYE